MCENVADIVYAISHIQMVHTHTMLHARTLNQLHIMHTYTHIHKATYTHTQSVAHNTHSISCR